MPFIVVATRDGPPDAPVARGPSAIFGSLAFAPSGGFGAVLAGGLAPVTLAFAPAGMGAFVWLDLAPGGTPGPPGSATGVGR
ncbi:MAG: hypothetical protein KIS78_27200, partial [Labilithrix sp.]|nr:hypothetical protein [Labilithrix sp.]